MEYAERERAREPGGETFRSAARVCLEQQHDLERHRGLLCGQVREALADLGVPPMRHHDDRHAGTCVVQSTYVVNYGRGATVRRNLSVHQVPPPLRGGYAAES